MPIAVDMKNIAEGIEVSYGERMSWLANTTKNTHQMMSRIRNDHKAMAKDLGVFLDGSESTRMAEFRGMLSSIQTRQKEREEEVERILNKFAQEIKEMAVQLKEFLSHSEGKRLEEFKSMLSAIKSRQSAGEEEIAGLLSEYQKDIREARTHWQNLAKIMASKRTGQRVPITEVPKEAEVPKRVEEAAEEAFEEGDLKARVLRVIEGNPQGISLRQIGERLNIAYVRLGSPVNQLIEEGRVVKRDSIYLPA